VGRDLWGKVCSPSNLNLAWNRVRENRGAPGVDQVTIDQFERNLDGNLSSLHTELEAGAYSPLPVLRFYASKEEGSQRPIGIPAVRDRVVQQSVLAAISPVFEKEFLDCSFAYRPGRSALAAVARVETFVTDGCPWVFDADIESFFHSIDHGLLMQFLSQSLSDDRILDLVGRFLTAGVFEDMTLQEEYLGIVQGSVISPLLANVYLHPLDQELTDAGYHLIRYADDFVVLESTQERAAKSLADASHTLKELKLRLNEKKSRLLHSSEGFVFLGYHIDAKGKGASRKAVQAITHKMTEISRSNGRKNTEAKLEELTQCLRGWMSYFDTCRGIEPQDGFLLVTLLEASLESADEKSARRLLEKRKSLVIDDPDIHYRLGRAAQAMGMLDEALDEFAETLALQEHHIRAGDALRQIDLVDEDVYRSIERLRRLIHVSPGLPQPYRDLAQCYAEVGEYGLAKEAYLKASQMEGELDHDATPVPQVIPLAVEPSPLSFPDEDVSLFLSLFRGRDGCFARQWVDAKGRRGFYPEARSLAPEDIKAHLAGEQTLGFYLVTESDEVHVCVIDIDISQRVLLEYAADEERLAELQHQTTRYAARLAAVCDDLGIQTVVEDSGYKGRHLWFFLAAPVAARLVRRFLRFICDRSGDPPPGIHTEIFPTSDKVKAKGLGCLIKLPLGIHKRTGRRCLFLDRTGNPLPDQASVLTQVARLPERRIEEVLLAFATATAPSRVPKGQTSSLVASLLSGCQVVSYLVRKAERAHYLDNAERVTLLYTLGHLGQEGRDFLHKVIGNCINYDYEMTEKQIRKMKPYPISCARIREKHEDFVLDLDCNCKFKLPKNGYPSPILHAFGQTKTWPVSLAAAAEKADLPESEAGPRTGDLNQWLRQYIELRRQLRGVENSLGRVEEKMSQYFDGLGTDGVQTQYGLLERRKSGDRLEWIIRM